MDAQLTQVWHKGSRVVSRTHGIDCHSAKLKVDALQVDPQLYNSRISWTKHLFFGVKLVLTDCVQQGEAVLAPREADQHLVPVADH